MQLFGEPIPVLSFIADPDGLLKDNELEKRLKDKNITVVEYREPMFFRYIYESKYSKLVEAKKINLAVICEAEVLNSIPYDLLVKGVGRHISVGDLFPSLSPTIVRALDKEELDLLYEVYKDYSSSNSDSATLEFVLKKLYGFHYEFIKTKEELIKFLLSKHYKNKDYPVIINNYIIDKLSSINTLRELPLKELLTSSNYFYNYLQEAWEAFIVELVKTGTQIQESELVTTIEKDKVFFFDTDVRLLLDNLFAEGKLEAVKVEAKGALPGWTEFGVVVDYAGAEKSKLVEKIFHLSEKLSSKMAYRDWIDSAYIYADIMKKNLEINEGEDEELNNNLKQLQLQIDKSFQQWLVINYDGLVNRPYLPQPVMLQHIPHYLASKTAKKVALVVLDCMSLLQWSQIKDSMKDFFEFEENGVFAWIPTITSISRQAIFAGELPVYYSKSINTTSKESNYWQLFWENQGILKLYVDYKKVVNILDSEDEIISLKANNKVLAVVIDTLDEFVHSATQGYKGVEAEIGIWLKKGYLKELFERLLEQNYELYIVSDHGNRECRGAGKITEGTLAYTRGERLRLYNSKLLRDEAVEKYKALAWDSAALPEGMYPLLAKAGEAFVAEGKTVVSHGGMSIEEVIVPFIRIVGKNKKEN